MSRKKKTVMETSLEKPYYVSDADMNTKQMLHGGQLFKIIDSYAGRVAMAHAERDCVTISFDKMVFKTHVYTDEMLIFRLSINRSWRTTMEVGARVHVVRDGKEVYVSSAYLTFVSHDGKPVPQVIPETEDEIRRFHQADMRKRNRVIAD